MLAGLERVITVEEVQNVQKHTEGPTVHHKTAPGLQSMFLKDVRSFTKVVSEMGNPFLATNQELGTLDTLTMLCMANEVAVLLSHIHEV